ncbi:hypothetical protein QL285_023275 [Trifolium repens]|nr:hypothetical protein QL285_023275 [Trifolium repens]
MCVRERERVKGREKWWSEKEDLIERIVGEGGGGDTDEHTSEDGNEHAGDSRETKNESEKRENYYYNGNFKYKNRNTMEKVEDNFPFFFLNGLFTFLFNFKK